MSLTEPRTHPLRRVFAAMAVVVFASCLAAASNGAPNARAHGNDTSLSNFDYLVLASIADSRQPFALAGYHSTVAPPSMDRPNH